MEHLSWQQLFYIIFDYKSVHVQSLSDATWSESSYLKLKCRGFGRESLLEEHKKIDHLGLKPYVCEFCQMAFKRSADWKGHLKRAHSKNKPFQCSKCSTTFTTTALLGSKYVL